MRVYVRLAIVGALVAGFTVGALAQVPPAAPAPAPKSPPPGQGMMGRGQRPMNPDRAAEIRAQIEERWGERLRAELGLTDQQMERLRTVSRANQDRQRDFSRREADLMEAVSDQLHPGVAANQDSLARSLDALAALQVQRAQSDQQELRELGQFLNPVQRARLIIMRRRLMDRIDEIRVRGVGPGDGMGVGAGRGMRMGPGMMPPARRDSQPEIDQ